MNAIKYITLFLFGTLFFAACIQPSVYPDEPMIEYVSINKNVITQGSISAGEDTLVVTFSFTDGDGDLSQADSVDIFFVDSRQGAEIPFKFPLIAEDGAANGISGEVTVRLRTQPAVLCCNYLNGDNSCTPHPGEQDTVVFSIQIRDRALNYSNTIETEPIYILCE